MGTIAADILREAGLDQTFWGVRIIRAQARGQFRMEEKNDADNWVCCACGDSSRRHGFDLIHTVCPKDQLLFELGQEFSDNVSTNDFIGAANTLVKIENRAIEITRKK